MNKFLIKNPQIIGGYEVHNDINDAIECLKNGQTIARFEYGDSLYPILESGEYCIISPINDLNEIEVGDVVLCNVNGINMTHLVIMKSTASNGNKPLFLIGDSVLNIYGWTDEIFAKCKGSNYIEEP